MRRVSMSDTRQRYEGYLGHRVLGETRANITMVKEQRMKMQGCDNDRSTEISPLSPNTRSMDHVRWVL
jgi:hypothetical protein